MPSEKETDFYNDNDKYRFHLQFNTNDKDQEFAAQLLLTMGRKKSAFVATAIRFYMEHSAEFSMGRARNLVFIDREDLKSIVKQEILNSAAEIPVSIPSAPTEPVNIPKNPVPDKLLSPKASTINNEPQSNDSDDNVPSPDAIDLMLDGLNVFM